MTASDMQYLLDMYEDFVYSKRELPAAAIDILDVTTDLVEAWHAMPSWLQTEVSKVLADADNEDLCPFKQDLKTVLRQLQRVRDMLRARGLYRE